jgi:hypothetical protein
MDASDIVDLCEQRPLPSGDLDEPLGWVEMLLTPFLVQNAAVKDAYRQRRAINDLPSDPPPAPATVDLTPSHYRPRARWPLLLRSEALAATPLHSPL